MTLVGVWFWEPMAPRDWPWMAALCLSGAFGHWLMIRCYAVAEASVVQPFAYFQLVFVSLIGVSVFNEAVPLHVVAGAGVIVAAGLFSFWREAAQGRAG